MSNLRDQLEIGNKQSFQEVLNSHKLLLESSKSVSEFKQSLHSLVRDIESKGIKDSLIYLQVIRELIDKIDTFWLEKSGSGPNATSYYKGDTEYLFSLPLSIRNIVYTFLLRNPVIVERGRSGPRPNLRAETNIPNPSLKSIVDESRDNILALNSRDAFISGLMDLHQRLLNANLSEEETRIVSEYNELINNIDRVVLKKNGDSFELDSSVTQPMYLNALPEPLKNLIITGLSRFYEQRTATISFSIRQELSPGQESIRGVSLTQDLEIFRSSSSIENSILKIREVISSKNSLESLISYLEGDRRKEVCISVLALSKENSSKLADINSIIDDLLPEDDNYGLKSKIRSLGITEWSKHHKFENPRSLLKSVRLRSDLQILLDHNISPVEARRALIDNLWTKSNNLRFIYSYVSEFPELSTPLAEILKNVTERNFTETQLNNFNYNKFIIPAELSGIIDFGEFVSIIKIGALSEWQKSHSPDEYYLKGDVYEHWLGIFSNTDNPQDIVAYLNKLKSELSDNNLNTSEVNTMIIKFSQIREAVEKDYAVKYFEESHPHRLYLERIYNRIFRKIFEERRGNQANIDPLRRLYSFAQQFYNSFFRSTKERGRTDNVSPSTTLEYESIKKPSREKVLSEIKGRIKDHPENVRRFFSKYERSFPEIFQQEPVEIDGNFFLFSNFIDSHGFLIALQKSKNDSKSSWSLRFYRMSGSDLQPKCLFSKDVNGRYWKGDELNSNHHYTTSGKLSSAVSIEFDKVRAKKTQFTFDTFMPTPDKIDFRESTFELKNEPLNSAISRYRDIYDIYDNFTLKDGLAGAVLGKIRDSETREILRPYCDKQLVYEEIQYLKDFVLSRLSEIQLEIPPSFFDIPLRSYKTGDIEIEEFLHETPEGDKIVFCMGRTDNGIVFVDRVYGYPETTTKHGTVENIVNFGLLTYKPYDYTKQTVLLDASSVEGSKYSSLQNTFIRIPLIQDYIKSLKRRNMI